jgi:hypothetical protein
VHGLPVTLYDERMDGAGGNIFCANQLTQYHHLNWFMS